MSDIAVVAGGRAAWRDGPDTGPDTRRVLQLALAGLWLLDALLQYQPMMFSRAFGQTLAATADGNPGFIARPITWDAALIQQHAVALNVVFATITGAPGAAILYALLAVLLWPARPVDTRAARALWLVLWLALAWLALQPANRAPWALHDTLAGMGSGEPGRMAALERDAAAVIGGHGLAASIVLAAAFTLVAVGVYLPRPAAVTALVLAIAIAGVIWVIGEAFGMILAGGATDPDTGPLLALLALAYWPARTAPGEGGRS
jgi:hypothetical protein